MSVEYPTYERRSARGTVVAYPVRVDLQQEDDVRLTAAVLSKLAAGTLPDVPICRVWVGDGTGATCDACDCPISRRAAEYELNANRRGVFHFHRECFLAWQRERAWYQGRHRDD